MSARPRNGLGRMGMDNEAGDKPLWSKLAVWIAYAPLTLLLLAFLAIMMAAEWTRLGWWPMAHRGSGRV